MSNENTLPLALLIPLLYFGLSGFVPYHLSQYNVLLILFMYLIIVCLPIRMRIGIYD